MATKSASHATLIDDSDHGVDQNGASYVDLAAIGGRSGFTAPSFNDIYTGLPSASSYAAPVVTGALAGLKHELLEKTGNWGPSIANQPGMLYALLLLGTGMPDVVGFEDYTILVLHSPWCINQDKSAKTTFYLENDVLLVDVELTPVGIEIEVNSGVAGIYGIPLQHVFDSVEVEFR